MVVAAGAVTLSATSATDLIPAVTGLVTGLVRFYGKSAAQATVAALVAGSAAGGSVTGTAAATATAAFTGVKGPALALKALGGAAAGLSTSSLTALTLAEVASFASCMATASGLGLAACLTLGAAVDDSAAEGVSYDCWRAVVRDWSSDESRGRLLWDVAKDRRVKDVSVSYSAGSLLPDITVENVWHDKFVVDYVILPSHELACHARAL